MNKLTLLKKILYGNVKLIRCFDIEQPALLEDEVIIKPKIVKKILFLYLNGNITADELQEWAEFICLRSEYVVPGGADDSINNYYESMYYVIQKLSTPEIDGEINRETVKNYLFELDKYND